MQVSEGAIAEASKESKATRMSLIPVSMVTTYIDHERTPPLPEVSGFDHLITSTVLVADLWWLGYPDGALPAKGKLRTCRLCGGKRGYSYHVLNTSQ